ncbi:MAG: DNA internalization-related competence protein ComEC/Rec2, partial [Lachnospiraceae bacterium]|nr:DNA internalization-related competence protein ComEC/Rec2 [Lachnospiraceae bacterium]
SELNVARNPGNFNYKEYLKDKRIYYSFSASNIEIKSPKINYIKYYLLLFKNLIKKAFFKALPSKEAGILSALFLGDKSLLDMDIKNLYTVNGIGHILAISGLHVTIVGMFFLNMMLFFGMDRRVGVIVTILFILLYGEMTGFGVSTSRACIMLVIALIAGLIKKTYDINSALALSALIILIQNPNLIYSCSFLLSYAAILGIIIIIPELEGFKSFIIKSLIASLSIQLFTLPIIMHFYYEIPPYSVLLNIIVIPLAQVLVICAFAGGVFGAIILLIEQSSVYKLFFISKVILNVPYYLLKLIDFLCNLVSKLPGNIRITGCPSNKNIFIYYSILLLIIFIFRNIKNIKFIKKKSSNNIKYILKVLAPYKLTILVIYIVISIRFLSVKTAENFEINMIDVGQGDGILISSPSGQNILIDGGSTDVKEVGKYRIMPFLKYSGVSKIDYSIITHMDDDHISGLKELIEQNKKEITIKNLIVPDVMLKDDAYNNLVNLARENDINVLFISEGMIIKDDYLKILCLHPAKDFICEDRNTYSTTLYMEYLGKHKDNSPQTFLFTGDIEGEGEKHVMEVLDSNKYNISKEITLLKVAHHGSNNSTPDEFLSLTKPKYSIISAGVNNTYGHPSKYTLERLSRYTNNHIYITKEIGEIKVECDGVVLNINGYLD